LGLDIARTVTEAFQFVVTNERLAARIANDDPAGLGNDGAPALLGLAPRAAEVIEALRPLWRRARSDRCQRLGRRRRGRNGRGDRGRCAAR
jgi:hypothetical protein